MLDEVKNLASEVTDFFFPSHCYGCGRAVKGDAVLCGSCAAKLPRLPDTFCRVCGNQKQRCVCAFRVFHYEKITAPFLNSGLAQTGVYRMKFGGADMLSRFFAQEMVRCVRRDMPDVTFDLVTYVPCGMSRRARLGYDQSARLAQWIARELDCPYTGRVLRRRLLSAAQHQSLHAEERFSNAYESYYAGRTVRAETVLLVDDIKTTGASLDACASCLMEAGARHVYGVTALLTDNNG